MDCDWKTINNWCCDEVKIIPCNDYWQRMLVLEVKDILTEDADKKKYQKESN